MKGTAHIQFVLMESQIQNLFGMKVEHHWHTFTYPYQIQNEPGDPHVIVVLVFAMAII